MIVILLPGSGDYDPVYWGDIESGYDPDVQAIFNDLEQTNGRGIGFELTNYPLVTDPDTFASAIVSYDSNNTVMLTANVYSPNGADLLPKNWSRCYESLTGPVSGRGGFSMTTTRRRKRHSPEQIVRKVRDAEAMLNAGKTVGEACQALEVSEATFHRWQSQYGGMKASEAKRLKELEQENQRLKRLLAEAELDKAILREAVEGNC